MPREERNKKATTKALAEAAAKPGQAKITSLFTIERTTHRTESSDHSEPNPSLSDPSTSDKETVEIDESDDHDISQLESRSQIVQSVCMQATWVTCEDDFTSADKEKNAKNGRYFQGEWFKGHEWLAYNREENKAFCSICATYAGHTDTQKGVFGNYKVGFSQGPRRGWGWGG